MIRHVVCHKYKNEEEAQKIAPMLRALFGKVESLKRIEVGTDVLKSPRSYHLVLSCDFEDLAGLEAYKVHPAHKEVQKYIHSVMESSVSVDYEV